MEFEVEAAPAVVGCWVRYRGAVVMYLMSILLMETASVVSSQRMEMVSVVSSQRMEMVSVANILSMEMEFLVNILPREMKFLMEREVVVVRMGLENLLTVQVVREVDPKFAVVVQLIIDHVVESVVEYYRNCLNLMDNQLFEEVHHVSYLWAVQMV